MAVLQNKIDFALVIAVNHANPNGCCFSRKMKKICI